MTLKCLPFSNSKRKYTVNQVEKESVSSAYRQYKQDTRNPTDEEKFRASTKTEQKPPPKVPEKVEPKPEPIDSTEEPQERRAGNFGGRISENVENNTTPRYSKDETSRKFIESAILKNDFLKNLDRDQLNAVVDSMNMKYVEGNTFLIKEGDVGNHMYVAAEGKFDVLIEGKKVGEIPIGHVFGELALLYNATRQASIKVLTKSKVWELERKIFQQIMVRTGLKRRDDKVRFLKIVPLLSTLKDCDEILAKISDLLKVEFFPANNRIIKQGDVGNTFYIISGGSVKITKKQPGSDVEEDMGTFSRGQFFGERALLSNDRRQATVTALSPGVECLVLEREPFIEFLGPLEDLKPEKWVIDKKPSVQGPIEYEDLQLKDLQSVATLGVGGFGRVELVSSSKQKNKTFALKCLKKVHVVQQQQEQHVFNEKKVMMECKNCQFIIRLYRTYKDQKYVYFLMEPCLGGDLFTLLQKNHLFNEQTSRFMTACVILAFEYLHERNIVYRDLKPENVMLDNRGYLKVIDFGFAKKLPPSSKTWTFAGTPEYVAPEIILGKGHDRAADYWTLGIFMHELLVGKPPFRGSDHMRTYNHILKGIQTVHFPKHMTKNASRLICKLCRAVPTERLGYQRNGIKDIKTEPWFHGFKWEALEKGTMKAPVVPQISGPADTRYFDKYPRTKDVPPDETSGWDKEF